MSSQITPTQSSNIHPLAHVPGTCALIFSCWANILQFTLLASCNGVPPLHVASSSLVRLPLCSLQLTTQAVSIQPLAHWLGCLYVASSSQLRLPPCNSQLTSQATSMQPLAHQLGCLDVASRSVLTLPLCSLQLTTQAASMQPLSHYLRCLHVASSCQVKRPPCRLQLTTKAASIQPLAHYLRCVQITQGFLNRLMLYKFYKFISTGHDTRYIYFTLEYNK